MTNTFGITEKEICDASPPMWQTWAFIIAGLIFSICIALAFSWRQEQLALQKVGPDWAPTYMEYQWYTYLGRSYCRAVDEYHNADYIKRDLYIGAIDRATTNYARARHEYDALMAIALNANYVQRPTFLPDKAPLDPASFCYN